MDKPGTDRQGLTLAIDTSGDLCSVSLARGTTVLDTQTVLMPHGQSGIIFSLIQALKTDVHQLWEKVSEIIVNRGPGSFTGLRTGLSVAAGLALEQDISVVGLTAFHICRAHSNIANPLSVFLKTRRGDYYTAVYSAHAWQPVETSILSMAGVKTHTDGKLQNEMITDCDVVHGLGIPQFKPSADRLFLARSIIDDRDINLSCTPFYMRDPEVHAQHSPKT